MIGLGLSVPECAVRRMAAAVGATGLTTTSFADSVASGAVLSAINVPAGYALELLEDCNGKYAISGTNLVRGANWLEPGVKDQPTILATKNASVGQDYYLIRPVITVTQASLFSDISGLQAAWDFNDATGGATVATIPGTAGTSNTLTGVFGTGGTNGVPTIESGTGPSRKSIVIGGSSTDRKRLALASPIALTDWTVVFCACSPTISGTQGIFGGVANTTLIGFGGTGSGGKLATMSVRLPGMAAAVTMGLPTAALVSTSDMARYVIRFNGTSLLCECYRDDFSLITSATLTGAIASSIASLFGFGGGGGAAGGSGFINGIMGFAAIYNRCVTDDEVKRLLAMAAPWASTSLFFSTAGSDANRGWNTSYSKQDATTFINAHYPRPGQQYRIRDGDEYRPLATLIPTRAGATGLRSLLTSWNGGKWSISGTTKVPAGSFWTAAAGKWIASVAAQPSVLWYLTGTTDATTGLPDYQGLYPLAGTGSDNTFEWVAGVLTIRLDGVLNANALTFELANAFTSALINNNQDYWRIENIDAFGAAGSDLLKMSGDQSRWTSVTGRMSFKDCFSAGASGNLRFVDCTPFKQGTGPANFADNTDDDGITCHGTTVAEIIASKMVQSNGYGFAMEKTTTITARHCLFYRNAKQASMLAQGGVGNGVHTYTNCSLEVPPTTTDGVDSFPEAIRQEAGVVSPAALAVGNCKFTRPGALSALGPANRIYSGGSFSDLGGNTIDAGFTALSGS